MNPNGMTNVTIGLVWAWHALTPNHAIHQSRRAGAGPGQGHHHPHRRRQHRSLGQHQQQEDHHPFGDRRPHGGGLREHQGGEYQDLCGARDRRQCRAVEELRHEPEHVLRRAAGKPAQRRVHCDRPEPRQSTHRQVKPAPLDTFSFPGNWNVPTTKSPANSRAFTLLNAYATNHLTEAALPHWPSKGL